MVSLRLPWKHMQKSWHQHRALPTTNLWALTLFPTSGRAATITPVPIKHRPKVGNDFKPADPMSGSVFERITMSLLSREMDVFLDPFQFAYKQECGSDDAVTHLVAHLLGKHLEDCQSHVHACCLWTWVRLSTTCSHICLSINWNTSIWVPFF